MKNLSDAFKELKKQDHNKSFENLGEWLDKNNQTPKTMKSIYKIAASILIASLGLVTCTVPVEHEEEIGYMIKGYTNSPIISMKKSIAEIPSIDLNQLSINEVIHEIHGQEKAENLYEVIMILPEADKALAEEKRSILASEINFKSINILPIEETVERTIMESALQKFKIRISPKIPQEDVLARINTFLHEHSNSDSEAEIKVDESGKKYVVLELNGKNLNGATKQSIELLYNDISGTQKFELKGKTEEEILEMKQNEIKKRKLEEEQNK